MKKRHAGYIPRMPWFFFGLAPDFVADHGARRCAYPGGNRIAAAQLVTEHSAERAAHQYRQTGMAAAVSVISTVIFATRAVIVVMVMVDDFGVMSYRRRIIVIMPDRRLIMGIMVIVMMMLVAPPTMPVTAGCERRRCERQRDRCRQCTE